MTNYIFTKTRHPDIVYYGNILFIKILKEEATQNVKLRFYFFISEYSYYESVKRTSHVLYLRKYESTPLSSR